MTADDSLFEGGFEDIEDDETEIYDPQEPPIVEADKLIALKSKLKDDLLKLPDIIIQLGTVVYQQRKEVENLNEIIRQVEKKTALDVAMATDDNGKKKYSNSEIRESEAINRLNNDMDYQGVVLGAKELRDKIDNNAVQLEFLNNSFKSARALALLIGSD